MNLKKIPIFLSKAIIIIIKFFTHPILIFLLSFALCIFTVKHFNDAEYPRYRVMLDPGHGGLSLKPQSKHGDRYDLITRSYLDNFKEGAGLWKMEEREIVYILSIKTKVLLSHLAPDADHRPFYKILEKYTSIKPERIDIMTGISRGPSVSEEAAASEKDPNAEFRLFDYPDADGKIQPGRLSRINAFMPHLLVSLHLASSAPNDYQGMDPIIVPPYEFLKKGLEYLRDSGSGKGFFFKSPFAEWFNQSTSRSEFKWFLNDTSLYFTGFPLDERQKVTINSHRGYRYNMIDWAYSDPEGWDEIARIHPPRTRYSSSITDFVPNGRFWEREKSVYEAYRRDGGYEGYGGDNAYASFEIGRFINWSIYKNSGCRISPRPGKAYFSVWIVPLHVNAINAFLELGYLNRYRDRLLFKEKTDEIAEGIAVGIFSLLAGLKPEQTRYRHPPKGKKIDLEKYRSQNNESYFEMVIDR
jgi:hypothetical protein